VTRGRQGSATGPTPCRFGNPGEPGSISIPANPSMIEIGTEMILVSFRNYLRPLFQSSPFPVPVPFSSPGIPGTPGPQGPETRGSWTVARVE
jgi:hypothetical protein